MSDFVFTTTESVSLEELDTAAAVLDASTALLQESKTYDEIWPKLRHSPERPHHFFVKYSEPLQRDTLLFWNYLDPGNRMLFYQWCVYQDIIDCTCWSPRRLWNAALWLLIIDRYLGEHECIHIWGVERGKQLFQTFQDVNRAVLPFYLQLSDQDKPQLHKWMTEANKLLNEGKSPCNSVYEFHFN